jgi:hypothetical protein
LGLAVRSLFALSELLAFSELWAFSELLAFSEWEGAGGGVLDFSASELGAAGAESPDVDSDFDAFLRDSDG